MAMEACGVIACMKMTEPAEQVPYWMATLRSEVVLIGARVVLTGARVVIIGARVVLIGARVVLI